MNADVYEDEDGNDLRSLSLDELLDRPTGVEYDEDDVDEIGAPRPRWRIVDIGGADWAMRKIAKLEAEKREVAAHVAAQIEMLRQWQLDVCAPMQGTIDYMGGLIRDYHVERIEGDIGVNVLRGPVSQDLWVKRCTHKSLPLPNGTSKAQRSSGTFSAIDAEVAVGWLKRHRPDLVKVTETVASTPFSKGIEDASVEVTAAGRYLVRVESDAMTPDLAEQVHEALVAGTDFDTILDEIIAPIGSKFRGIDGVVLRVSRMLGDEQARYEVWLPVPGVCVEGIGRVSMTVKPTL